MGPGLLPGPFGQPGTDSRSVGAFNARVRNSSSLVTSRPSSARRRVVRVAITDLLIDGPVQAEDLVVDAE